MFVILEFPSTPKGKNVGRMLSLMEKENKMMEEEIMGAENLKTFLF